MMNSKTSTKNIHAFMFMYPRLITISVQHSNIIIFFFFLQPKTGVLGTHKKAGVFEMIMSGRRYPDGYFWKVEMVSVAFWMRQYIGSEQHHVCRSTVGYSSSGDTNYGIQFCGVDFTVYVTYSFKLNPHSHLPLSNIYKV